MDFAIRCVVVFTTSLCGAWCWGRYIQYCQEKKAIRASVADCGIIGFQLIGVVSVTDDRRLALPLLLAAFLGTYLSVRGR